MKLELQHVHKYFGDSHVLDDINFTVNSGQIFGYLGRNGAGKTTSIRIIMDVFEQSLGAIMMDGIPFLASHYKIGYLPEERGMYSKILVEDQLIYFAMLRGATKSEAKETVDFWAHRLEIDQYLKRKLETLSKGNQQKVQIAQAFLNNPDILILDEPFSGLDPVNSQIFQEALSEYISPERIIIFSSHQMSYVETFCDDIAIIDKGKIILNGSLDQIKKEEGKNKLYMEANNASPEILLTLLKDYSCTTHQDGVMIHMNDYAQKRDILSILYENTIDLHQFLDFEPSLQEIFVSYTGGSDHE